MENDLQHESEALWCRRIQCRKYRRDVPADVFTVLGDIASPSYTISVTP